MQCPQCQSTQIRKNGIKPVQREQRVGIRDSGTHVFKHGIEILNYCEADATHLPRLGKYGL